MRLGTTEDFSLAGSGSVVVWSSRTIPLAGLAIDGSTDGAGKTSGVPFWVKLSLRSAADGMPALVNADPSSRDWRILISSDVAERVVNGTTHVPPHASMGLPEASLTADVTTIL